MIFAIACRNLWLQRNNFVSNGVTEIPEAFKAKTLSFVSWASMHMSSIQQKSDSSLAWVAPSIGRVKLNVDAVFSYVSGLSACGGIIRNDSGQFIYGFMVNLGSGTCESAEFWAVIWGLKLVWALAFRCVDVDRDCALVVDAIKGSRHVSGFLLELLQNVNQ